MDLAHAMVGAEIGLRLGIPADGDEGLAPED
jgi:hypothetical protein